MWIDRQGKTETIPVPRRAFQSPSLSPDGRRIAVEVAEGPRSDVWIFEFATGSFSRLTSTGLDGMPLWSTDGQRLAYAARRDEERHIMWQPLDGSAAPESLVRSRNRIWPSAWTPDGKGLVFVEDPPTSLPDIKLLNLDDRAVSPLVAGPQPEMLPSLSPDGRWIVYTMFEKGPHVMVRPFSGGAAREITPDGGAAPRWLANGREIVSRHLTTLPIAQDTDHPGILDLTARGALSLEDATMVCGSPTPTTSRRTARASCSSTASPARSRRPASRWWSSSFPS